MSKKAEAPEKVKLTVTIDAKMKRQFTNFCEDVGLPMGAVLTALMRQVVRKQEVRLSALDLNGFTPAEAAELRRRVREVSEGKGKLYALAED